MKGKLQHITFCFVCALVLVACSNKSEFSSKQTFSYVFNSEESTQYFELSTGAEYEEQNEYADWITVQLVQPDDEHGYQLAFTVEENQSKDSRRTMVAIKAGYIDYIFNIVQEGADPVIEDLLY